MSAKSDRDNRANQLNPNNSAYNSSRARSTSDSDDDCADSRGFSGEEAVERALARETHKLWVQERERPVATTFRAAFVSLRGPMKVIDFSVTSKPFMGDRGGCQAINEDLAELLVEVIDVQLSRKWKSGLALRALYDEKGSDFFWAGYEYPHGQINGSDYAENARLWNAYAKEAVDRVRSFLSSPKTDADVEVEDWGQLALHPGFAVARITSEHQEHIAQLVEKSLG